MRLRLVLLLCSGLLGCELVLGTADYQIGLEGGAGHASGGGGQGTGAMGGAGGLLNGGAPSVGGAGGAGAEGGAGGGGCDLPADQKPILEVAGDIEQNFTMTCDTTYKLVGEVFVQPPAILTIEPQTTIFGDKVTGAVLIVRPGAKLIAKGEPDKPIIFTSEGGQFSDPGDWGGVILLGNAPINTKDINGQPTQQKIEGILDDTNAFFGGSNPTESSGEMSYVRLEYGGKAVAPNNEVNGLTFGGVGSGTTIHHIMVRQTTDDCYEWFGGTVDAHHLICQSPGDDGFDWDNGFVGRLQFLLLQQDPLFPSPADMNGFEGDNDAGATLHTPFSNPTIYNATLCGQNYTNLEQFGALLRRETHASLHNLLIAGFEGGVDVRNGSGPSLILTDSLFVFDSNLNQSLAFTETGAAPNNDDDAGFDEIAWLTAAANNNDTQAGAWPGCNNTSVLGVAPATELPAPAPPDDGFFDATADFVGAFRDSTDNWASGAWVEWAPN